MGGIPCPNPVPPLDTAILSLKQVSVYRNNATHAAARPQHRPAPKQIACFLMIIQQIELCGRAFLPHCPEINHGAVMVRPRCEMIK